MKGCNRQMKKAEILFRNNSYFTREAYKSLRTNISFCGDEIKVICLTSCEANEGKSTISLELSKSLAEINKSKDVTHVVKRHETLSKIAAEYNTTVQKIASDNNIKNPNLIFEGQKLIIKK